MAWWNDLKITKATGMASQVYMPTLPTVVEWLENNKNTTKMAYKKIIPFHSKLILLSYTITFSKPYINSVESSINLIEIGINTNGTLTQNKIMRKIT